MTPDDHPLSSITALVEGVFDSLDRIAQAMAGLWDGLESQGTAAQSTDLAGLRDAVLGELDRQGSIFNGTGVVVADSVLADRPRYLEWWRRDSREVQARKLMLDMNPHSEYFYDYSTMDWFTAARDRDTRWIHGPYLDYMGVDLYVCTFSMPIRSGRGRFLGVAAADVPLASLDAALMPAFRSSRRPQALVNAEGRVIIANHPDHVTGSRLRTGPAPSRPVPATPWALYALDWPDSS